MTNSTENHPEKLHTIGTVSDVTGVNAITLRAWQRRYGLIQPKRTVKGHRLFTDDDIARIKEILFWLAKGVSIGKVADYLQHKKQPKSEYDEPDYEQYQRKAIDTVQTFDQGKLEAYMDEVFSLYPLDVISQKIYPRVLSALNEHWITSDTAFSEQQFFAFYLRNKLASTFLKPKDVKKGKKIIVTTLEEAFTELELLFLASALSLYGFEIILLGRKTLPQEWPKVIEHTECKGMVISVDTVGPQLNQVKRLASLINIPICVRTRTPLQEQVFTASNVTVLPENYHKLLAKINDTFAGE
jgi:DNA-binding transcriptional MerR regulator